jgi:hypothetical protein
MFSATADPDRQRMDIVSDQALTPDDFEKLVASVIREAARLKPGWVAAVDFRGMWLNDSFINEHFGKLQTALLAGKAGRIGTLLDSDALKMRLWQSGVGSGSNPLTQRFYNEKEWEAFLSASRLRES